MDVDVKTLEEVLWTILLIVPGYISYSLKEMWVSYREKSHFEKLLISLIYSSFIWLIILTVFDKFPKEYFVDSEYWTLLGWILSLSGSMFAISLLSTFIEQSKIIYKIGTKMKLSVKEDQNLPLFDNIFNDTHKPIASVEIRTLDGYTYYGRNRENKRIVTGTNPYTGDISFVCELAIDKDGKETPYEDSKLETGKLILRTYIPKENIKLIRYEEELRNRF